MTNTNSILARFYRDTVDASDLRGIDPEVVAHAVALGWIEVRGRQFALTAEGREERARQR